MFFTRAKTLGPASADFQARFHAISSKKMKGHEIDSENNLNIVTFFLSLFLFFKKAVQAIIDFKNCVIYEQ